MNNQLHKIAMRALELGWSLIPVAKDKKPLLNWKEYQTRKATKEEIDAWFLKYPDMQLGVVCGSVSNLTILDIEEGTDFNVPDKTFRVKTGGNGIHVYFQYDADFKNAVRVFPLVDWRSEGGVCVMLGSVSTKGPYTMLDGSPVAKMSQATKDLLLSGKKPVYQKSAQQFIPSQQAGGEVFNYQGAEEGSRNSEMTAFIGLVLSQTHPAKWNEIAWPTVQAANQKNQPPLSDSELLSSFNSIRNREISSAPDKWSKRTPEEIKKEQESLKDDSLALMKEVADTQNRELNTSIPVSTGYKKIDDALKGGFRLGDLIVMSGETGQGKTLAASNMAVNMAERGDSVLFLTYEVFVSEVWEKMKDMGVKDDIKIYTPKCHTSGRLAWVQKKIQEAKEYGVKFVVIDHLEFLTADDKFAKNVNLNFSNKISEVVKEVKNIARNEGVIILLLCHLRKVNQGRPGINDLKDTVSIGQESDCVILVERIKLNNPQNSDDIYSPVSLWSIQKNRRNGKNCYVEVVFMDGRMVETEKVEINRRNEEAKEATGENVQEPITEESVSENPIQSLLNLGFGGAVLS